MAHKAARSGLILGAMLLAGTSCGSGIEETADNGSVVDANTTSSTSSTTQDDGTVTTGSSDQTGDSGETADASSTTDDTPGDDAGERVEPDPTTAGAPDETPVPERPDNSETSATAPEPTADGGSPATGSGHIDSGLQPYIDDAVAQLGDSHGIAPSAITVESARLVQWRNSSAGCPEPRMQYTQVLTDGSLIELVADGATYWFHSGGRRGPFLCTSPLRETPPE